MEAKNQEVAGTKRPHRSPPALSCTVRIQVIGLTAAIDAVERSDGTINRCLYSIIDRILSKSANPRPDSAGVHSANVTVDASRGLWARVYSPTAVASSSPLPLIVYFHGGGFALFSPAIGPFDGVCRRYCSEVGAVVFSVNYRLAPEHRYPAAYDDGVAFLNYLDATGLPGLAVPVDLSSCFLAGESAGGNIAHHVAQRWTATSQPSAKSVRLAGIIPVQPYFGGEERTEAELSLEGVAPVVNIRRSDWSWKAFLPVEASRDHPAAHVTEENANLAEGFPPAMVVVGGLDPLQDWQRRYADVLRRKGKAVWLVEFPEAFHGFYVFPELADSKKVMEDMREFVESNRASKSNAV